MTNFVSDQISKVFSKLLSRKAGTRFADQQDIPYNPTAAVRTRPMRIVCSLHVCASGALIKHTRSLGNAGTSKENSKCVAKQRLV